MTAATRVITRAEVEDFLYAAAADSTTAAPTANTRIRAPTTRCSTFDSANPATS